MITKWRALMVASALMVTIQFLGPKCLNPISSERNEFEADSAVTPELAGLVHRSCMDCHSNHTRWRWYSYVAPVSWYIVHHIEEGRKKLNFSTWSARRDSRGNVVHSVNDLEDICDVVSKGTMPFRSYTLMHPDAVLSAQERKLVCDWTDDLASKSSAPATH